MTETQPFTHIAFGLALAVIAFGITWLMGNVVRIMDRQTDRTAHLTPLPRGGGLSIVVAWLIGMAAITFVGEPGHLGRVSFGAVVLSSLLVAAVSFVDDIRLTSARFRLVTQIVAILVVLHSGIVLDEVAGHSQLGWIGYVVSFLWILGLANAYNFMDGLDGLAGGVAVLASLFFMVITYQQGSMLAYSMCYPILAGALGFVFLNLPPARVILGDVGAVFLGFVFAILAIIAARYDESHTSFLVMPLLMFNIIFDTSFTLIRRLLIGADVGHAHQTHLYQLLHRTGFSHLQVTLMQYGMVCLQGLGALWLVRIPGNERLWVFVPFLLFQVCYAVVVLRRAKKAGIDPWRPVA